MLTIVTFWQTKQESGQRLPMGKKRILGFWKTLPPVGPLRLNLQLGRLAFAHGQDALIPLWGEIVKEIIIINIIIISGMNKPHRALWHLWLCPFIAIAMPRWGFGCTTRAATRISYPSDDPAHANLEAQRLGLLLLPGGCRLRRRWMSEEKPSMTGIWQGLCGRVAYLWGCWCRRRCRPPGSLCTSSSRSHPSWGSLPCLLSSALTWSTWADPLRSKAIIDFQL